MPDTYLKILEAYKNTLDLDNMLGINESMHSLNGDPYRFLEMYYTDMFTVYKDNPNNYNKGRLQALWELMIAIIGSSRSNTIRSKAETTYAKGRR